ncbi:MAG: 2-amino-4-hydroxy-6-hydroxymethyldihydropteridine diphosphokinase [Acidimicrobiia bacterium]
MASGERVLIALGSNIDRERKLPEAVRHLGGRHGIEVLATSPVYETRPVGGEEQPAFFNAAVLVETRLGLEELKRVLREIESSLGRVRTADKNAPRTIDLDIAMVGSRELEIDGTKVPDPSIGRRPHLALPLADVAPDWVYPPKGMTLRELAAGMETSEAEIRRVTDTDVRLSGP